MKRIDVLFEKLKAQGGKALVGFITAGDPNPATSLDIVREMVRSGVDILELGVPFSDPTADGPVIQRSSSRAIAAGTTLKGVIAMVRAIRTFADVPVVLFSYYNPVLAYGGKRFYEDATAAGADGVLLVDLPPEESDEFTGCAGGKELALIRLIAPTTPPERMSRIAGSASGFIYMVSMTGVTGSGGLDPEEVGRCVGTLKERSGGIPVCVGFGVSTPDQARMIGALADGVVVGSAFERIIEDNMEDPDLPFIVGRAARDLKAALEPAA